MYFAASRSLDRTAELAISISERELQAIDLKSEVDATGAQPVRYPPDGR